MSESFARELRRLRGAMPIRTLAALANCGKSTIGDLETGRRRPTRHVAVALDKALGADGRLAELGPAEERQKRAEAPAAAARTAGGLPPERDDDMLRRNFMKSSAIGASTALGLIPQHDNPLDGTSQDLLAAHTDLRAVHGRIDNLRGAQAVFKSARDHHDGVRGWIATSRSDAERQSLFALAADTGGFVGFLTYDLGQAELAITHYQEAAAYAQRAGDISSCANLLGQTSRVLADLGHHDKALSLADQALHLGGTAAHPAVRCWLHAVRAHHHACLSQHSRANEDLKTAWKLLCIADDGETPPYIGYLSEPELHKWTGHTAVRLAASSRTMMRTGRRALDAARKCWPNNMVRGSAEMLTASARIYTAHGDLDQAGHLVDKAITIATATGSARNLRAALDARAAFPPGREAL
ncbi:helix-turn-helix domain-containing protein [Streptomyces griseoluteus]|uniref:helix-turn-helix domain-containing protein n=1 Tax=Streptomyces griseoluteus TaxID=29306 RepID=UPI00368E5029